MCINKAKPSENQHANKWHWEGVVRARIRYNSPVYRNVDTENLNKKRGCKVIDCLSWSSLVIIRCCIYIEREREILFIAVYT